MKKYFALIDDGLYTLKTLTFAHIGFELFIYIAGCPEEWHELIVLPGAWVWSLDTHFNLSPVYHLYVLFVKISYQARLCLQISYSAILFRMLNGIFKPREF